jgi:hypothetical protein
MFYSKDTGCLKRLHEKIEKFVLECWNVGMLEGDGRIGLLFTLVLLKVAKSSQTKRRPGGDQTETRMRPDGGPAEGIPL